MRSGRRPARDGADGTRHDPRRDPLPGSAADDIAGYPLVLCYHAASDSWTHALSLPPGRILRQVELFLRLRYRPAPLVDAVAGRGRLLHVTFDDAFRSADRVLPELERLGVPVTIFVCPRFADAGAPLTVPELAHEPRDELLTMAWDRIQELAARGVGVESHSLAHRHLPELSDGELDEDLREAKSALEDRLRRTCRFLAYPFGDEDERVRHAARRAGYEAAFAVEGRQGEPFALPRVAVYRGDGPLRVAGKTIRRGR